MNFYNIIMQLFNKAVDIIIKLVIPLVVLRLMIGVTRIFLDLRIVFKYESIAATFDVMVQIY